VDQARAFLVAEGRRKNLAEVSKTWATVAGGMGMLER
jgi:hypothetical protein